MVVTNAGTTKSSVSMRETSLVGLFVRACKLKYNGCPAWAMHPARLKLAPGAPQAGMYLAWVQLPMKGVGFLSALVWRGAGPGKPKVDLQFAKRVFSRGRAGCFAF